MNEEPLAIAVAASKRSRYYQPLVLDDDETALLEALSGSATPAMDACRGLARALAARSMLHLGEGNREAAWNDILALHRLARLVGQGPLMVEALLGFAIDGMATSAGIQLLQHAEPMADQARHMEADMRALPPLPSMAEVTNVGERFLCLSGATDLARGIGDGGPLGRVADPKVASEVDWDLALRFCNAWYDGLVDRARIPSYSKRREAFEEFDKKFEADMKQMSDRAKSPAYILRGLLGGLDQRKELGRAVGGILIATFLPSTGQARLVEDRQSMTFDITRVAIALAGYKAEHGEYPDTLDALAPKYIPEVPLDRYTDKPLVYKKTDDGYLLYALGPNLKDDGGTSLDDDRVNYDIVVRMPARE